VRIALECLPRKLSKAYLDLFCRNKKVIYSLNWSKEDMASAASREVPMTKQVVDSLTALGKIQ